MAVVDGLVVVGVVGAHEVGAGKKLIGGIDSVEVLAGDAEELRQTRASGNEDCVVSLDAHQFIERDAFADDHVGFKFDAQRAQVVYFLANDALGQAELWNAVDEDAAELVKRLKDADVMAFLDEVAGCRKTRGTAADDGHAFTGRRSDGRKTDLAAFKFEVGDEALEIADGERLAFAAKDAPTFTLILLRADAAGHGGQSVVFSHLCGGRKELAGMDERDDLLDFDADRALNLAAGLGTFDAARGFNVGMGGGQAKVDFIEAARADDCIEFGHMGARNLHAHLQRERILIRHGVPRHVPRPERRVVHAGGPFRARAWQCRHADESVLLLCER